MAICSCVFFNFWAFFFKQKENVISFFFLFFFYLVVFNIMATELGSECRALPNTFCFAKGGLTGWKASLAHPILLYYYIRIYFVTEVEYIIPNPTRGQEKREKDKDNKTIQPAAISVGNQQREKKINKWSCSHCGQTQICRNLEGHFNFLRESSQGINKVRV